MIAQTISDDALESFRNYLIKESFNLDCPSRETLGQVLSAWEDQRTKLYYKAKTELGQLIFLGCLEEAGVDNWEGYPEAWELAKKYKELKCL